MSHLNLKASYFFIGLLYCFSTLPVLMNVAYFAPRIARHRKRRWPSPRPPIQSDVYCRHRRRLPVLHRDDHQRDVQSPVSECPWTWMVSTEISFEVGSYCEGVRTTQHTRKKFILEELLNSSGTEDMRKIRYISTNFTVK